MAFHQVRDEVTCSICTDIYTDPVTLTCGHSYCRACITRTLDTQEEEEREYSCPECLQRFRRKPELKRNRKLCNIADLFVPSEPVQKKAGVPCTYCVEYPVPAKKTCLHCEASLCHNHLMVHSQSEEHVLTEPTSSIENRKCSIHKRVLGYYCLEDTVYICVSCLLAEEHRGHQVETLNEVTVKKKVKLRNILEKLTSEMEEAEKRLQSLLEQKQHMQDKVARVSEKVTALIVGSRQQLGDLQEQVLCEVSLQEEQISLRVSDLIRQLEMKKEELSRKMGHIEELCNTTDPLTVLQGCESDSADYCESEEKKHGDRERVDKNLQGLDDLDVTWISSKVYTGLAAIVTELKRQLDITDNPGKFLEFSRFSDMFPDINVLQDANVNTHSVSDMLLGVNVGSGIALVINLASDILLDVSTVGNNVTLSGDLTTASWSEISMSRPQTPERFQVSQVLSSRSFSSGRHYFEVEGSESGEWIIGMAYRSIDREGGQSYIGNNNKSWGLWRWDENQYYMRHDLKVIPLPQKPSSQKFALYLDYEAGHLLFYELCEPSRQLHTFTATFTEPLHVAFWIGRRGKVKFRSKEY
ncbi:E3 ubiquitin/ISG15 ligase TRIM25-like [Pelobates fuscus]|uniref:E3 ubiquitin/ISG15 ligase TRIM25-like n=1 Tax=Pelobates fuscus TaxID=191477 RepID=UPI002FE4C8C3